MNFTRVCSSCQEELTADNFYKKGNRLQAMCKSCFNSYCVSRWRNRKLEAIEKMGGVCADCNGKFHFSVYDFHHLDPNEKEFSWNKMRLVSDKKLYKELSKCVLLCSNCHRIRHYDEP